jgi:dTDP-4-dehydrorhamnose 3,5-epimerase-like enzyme
MIKKKWADPFDSLSVSQYVDERGMLFEILRFQDYNIPGNGQLYVFSINPGKRRGDHYHKKKQEWFTCVSGEVTILLTSKNNKNTSINISSDNPVIVYAGIGTSHALINNNEKEAIIVSYGSRQHDSNDEDTYYKKAYEGYK